MENRFFDDPTLFEVFDDDALEELRRHVRVPDALRIHDHDRAASADAEAWDLASLHASGAEEEIFSLEQSWKNCVESSAASLRRAEPARADDHVAGVGLHPGVGEHSGSEVRCPQPIQASTSSITISSTMEISSASARRACASPFSIS
jgi:hypothetical protein